MVEVGEKTSILGDENTGVVGSFSVPPVVGEPGSAVGSTSPPLESFVSSKEENSPMDGDEDNSSMFGENISGNDVDSCLS